MTHRLAQAVSPADAAAVLRLLPHEPRLLALGEPTHGEEGLLALRNDLFRHLVEHAGYRTVAMEVDCLRALVVDAYVTAGTGSLDTVMAGGFSHEWGAFDGNRDLVRWMRAHNDGRLAGEQVRFAGFDGPLEITAAASPREALVGLHDYLSARLDPGLLPCDAGTLDRLLGPDERWTEPAAMREPQRSVGRTPEAAELRLFADDLVALLESQTPQLAAAPGTTDWQLAGLHGRTAVGLLRYHHAMADTSHHRLGKILAARDAMMAANLLALADRGPTLVHAHNSHLQRDRSSMRMGGEPVHWWSAGAIAGAHLGDRYAFLATAVGTIRHRGVDTPPMDTVEGLLHALPGDGPYLAEPRRLAAALGDVPPPARESPWFGYAAFDPSHLGSVDGLVYVKDASSAAPIRA